MMVTESHTIPSESFFEVGKCYVFMPRINAFNMGEVVQVTPQEVVFKNIYRVTNVVKDDADPKAKIEQYQKLVDFINSKDRTQYLKNTIPGFNPVFSYSRGEMGAIELDRCGK